MQKNAVFFVSFFLLVVVYPQQVGAQSASSSPVMSPTITSPLNQRKQELKQQIKDARTQAREQYKAEIRKLRDQFKQNVSTLKDERKKMVIEKIDSKLGAVNERATTRMETIIAKLTSILNRVKEKASTAKLEGSNTTELDVAVLNAENVLATAAAAVSAQQEKEYVIPLQDDSTAKSSVGATLKQLHTDLSAVHQLVVDARQVVRVAVLELKKALQNDRKQNPSGTGTLIPTLTPTVTP